MARTLAFALLLFVAVRLPPLSVTPADLSVVLQVVAVAVENGPVGGVKAPPYIAVPVTTRTSSRRPGKYRLLLLSLPTTQAWTEGKIVEATVADAITAPLT